MSARWRRTRRNPKEFNIFESFNRVSVRNRPRTPEKTNQALRKQNAPWANKTPRSFSERKLREPQPLVDVFEESDEITIVAELVGFKREHLRTSVKNQRLTLSAEVADRKYYKSLNLPKRVIPKTLRTKYKNGVLEIRLKKVIEEKSIRNMAG